MNCDLLSCYNCDLHVELVKNAIYGNISSNGAKRGIKHFHFFSSSTKSELYLRFGAEPTRD